MAAPGGANQIARRVIDDLIEFSGETSANTAKNLVGQLNALIIEKEALEDQGEIFDTLMDLKDDREVARTKLQGLNEIITQAEQEIEMKEAQTQAMNGLRYGSILNILQGRNELLEKIIGIMETKANNLDDLVTYYNDNDIDDLGYESELYLDEEKEEDENNYSNFCYGLKNQGVLDPKATPPSTIQMIDENKTTPKLQRQQDSQSVATSDFP
ncbi:hypothetical protein Tco_0294582 [Tanacetum coccineum]